MRRKPTAEQRQAAAERRKKMRALAKRVGAMDQAEREALTAHCPIVTIEGRALSLFNMCMIMMQIPDATIVGGFRQWIKAGRCVRKGEHGAAIWVPIARKADADNPSPSADGEIDAARFMLGTVFDVSQTEEVQELAATA